MQCKMVNRLLIIAFSYFLLSIISLVLYFIITLHNSDFVVAKQLISTYLSISAVLIIIATLLAYFIRKKILFYQESLNEERGALQTALDSICEAVIKTDINGIIIQFNKAAEKYSGWTKIEAIGKRVTEVFDIISENNGTDIENVINKVLDSKEMCPPINDAILLVRDGREISVSVSIALIKENDDVVGVVLTFSDISERKNAISAMKNSRAQLDAIFEQSQLGIAFIDSQKGNFIKVNSKCSEILKRSAEDLKDIKWFDITHPDDIEEGKRQSNLLNKGEISSYCLHKRYICPDNSYVWVNITITKIMDEEGTPLHICIIEDITNDKRIENEIRKKEKRFRSLFNNMTNGVIIYDVINNGETDKDYIIKDINLAGQKLEYKAKEEIVGKSVYELRPKVSEFGIIEVFKAVWQTGNAMFSPAKLYQDTNYNNWYDNIVFKLDSGEIVAIYNDVTKQVVMNQKLQESEKQFRNAIENAPIPVMIFSEGGEVIAVNNIWSRITGYSINEIKTIEEWSNKIINTDQYTKDIFNSITKPKYNNLEGEYSIITKSDEIRTWNVYSAVIGFSNDRKMIMSTAIDTTDQKLINKELQIILDNSIDGFYIIDFNGNFINANNSFCKMIECDLDEIIHMSIFDLIEESEKDKFFLSIKHTIITGSDSFETMLRTKRGFLIDIEQSIGYLEENCCIYVFLRDITGRKKREKEILYLNYHDILTGLYNRAYFDELVKKIDKEENLPISIIMGDINGLKLINDGFGHFVGDKVLIEMADILKKSVGEDNIVARYGGDEFCILMLQADESVVTVACHNIYDLCNKYNRETINDLGYLSISLGYATKRNNAKSIYTIMKEAEAFMYRRKLLESKSMHSSLIKSIRSTMFEKSHETQDHAERLATLSKQIGEKLKLSEREMADLELFATLHDIGKMSITDDILNKPGKLTNDEWYEIKKHPEVGYRIAMTSPDINHIANLILTHHERWDGNGYPQGLKARNIPLLSRIIAIIDTYDAMTADRPYRKAMSEEEALKEIIDNAGIQFDPDIVDVFVKTIKENYLKR